MKPWTQRFNRARTGESSASLQEIFSQCSSDERELSPTFYADYGTGRGTGLRTPFCGIALQAGPLAHGAALVNADACVSAEVQDGHVDALEMSLSHALQASLPDTLVHVAVSGGTDSWLLAALLKQRGYQVCGWYLQTGLPGYCEQANVEQASRALGIPYRCVRADVQDFLHSLPAFTAAVQWPVYNLHPLSKWLLVQALRQEGVTAVVTGDGADQVMRWDWDCDLLPLTLGSFQAWDVQVIAPFLASEVIRCCGGPYPDKQPVRALVKRLGVPAFAKRPTFFPALELTEGRRVSLPESAEALRPERKAMLAYTTGLLLEAMVDASHAKGGCETADQGVRIAV